MQHTLGSTKAYYQVKINYQLKQWDWVITKQSNYICTGVTSNVYNPQEGHGEGYMQLCQLSTNRLGDVWGSL